MYRKVDPLSTNPDLNTHRIWLSIHIHTRTPRPPSGGGRADGRSLERLVRRRLRLHGRGRLTADRAPLS